MTDKDDEGNGSVLVGQKRCTKCGEIKDLTDFNKNKNTLDGLHCWCRLCLNAYRTINKNKIYARLKIWRNTHKEAISRINKTWREKNIEQLSLQQKVYRDANKERISTRYKTWRQSNKERVLAYNKIYWQKNKEQFSAEKKIYHKKNKVRILAQKKLYYQNNKDWLLSRRAAWQRANPEKHLAAMRRRRARKQQVPTLPFTSEMAKIMYEAQDSRCYYCREELNGIYDLEHKIPLFRGGSHTPNNIVLSCGSCNSRKWTMTDLEFFATMYCPITVSGE
jgi:5-methylcytosine-specific restriction endonuclease McrA